MSEAAVRVALAGNPNCGKTSLFNAMTGGRAKVGNYPGVTVERKEGLLAAEHERAQHGSQGASAISILDLPGTVSLDARTPDEQVTRDVLLGVHSSEKVPDVFVAVADATNLERSLALVLELKALGQPLVLALNMIDLARERGMEVDLEVLSKELSIPVVATVATRKDGIQALVREIRGQSLKISALKLAAENNINWKPSDQSEIVARFKEVDRILNRAMRKKIGPTVWTDRIDRFVLHPVFGSLLLLFVFGFIFQAIFNWAKVPMKLIESGIGWFGEIVATYLPAGPLQSLVVNGMIAGVGSVLVFLPQILILFLVILLLEDSGYMARAAFLMDRLMGKVGLHGRTFIPLLSSYACAIPGIMATRTIENPRDRLTTILVSPLVTCSARLPIYSLLIAAFIPNIPVLGPLRLQGLVMLGLYLAGIITALLVATFFKLTLFKGPKPEFLMELPTYKWPSLRSISIGLLERAQLFIRRAGTVILSISVLLWFLSSYPTPPPGADQPAISYSYAGRIGHTLEPLVRPIGFNWKIAVALIPGFAAREVMVGSLATVYAVDNMGEEVATKNAVPPLLSEKLSHEWSLATALSLLVWYVLACQCLSTLAVTRRETNSWKWPALMLTYMTALAYLGSFVTYQVALRFGL